MKKTNPTDEKKTEKELEKKEEEKKAAGLKKKGQSMRKTSIPKYLAATVIIVAILVLLGWIFGITFLKSISPNWITMKISTVLSFILSGMILYRLSREQEKGAAEQDILIQIATLALLLLMIPSLFAIFTGVAPAYDKFFFREDPASAVNPYPGRPAILTAVNFLLITAVGISTSLNYRIRRIYFWAGVIICLIGLATFAGYLLSMPVLYWPLPRSNPMAFHTGILFALLGAGFMLLAQQVKTK